MVLRDVSGFPLEDADRSGVDEWSMREIITDHGMAEPSKPEMDSFVRVPVRVSHNAGSGFTLEVGPYDFSGEDFALLEKAVTEMRRDLDLNN